MDSAAETLPPAGAVSRPFAPAGDADADEWAIVKITSLGHALCHLGELLFVGVTVALMSEFALRPDQATLLVLLGNVLMGAGALPVGMWANVWGPTRCLFVYFVAMAVGGLAVALAPELWSLFAALTLLGLATSIYHPAGVSMISLGVRARGRAMGINGVAGSLGIAVGPAVGMIAAALGYWRLAYLALALLSAGCAVYMWRFLKRHGTQLGSEGSAKPASGLSGRPAIESASPRWPLVFLFLAMMLGGFNYRCLVTALPPFLSGSAAEGKALATGGVFVALALLAGGIGQYFGGSLADRFGTHRLYPCLIAALVPLSLLLALLMGSPLAALVAACLAIGLFAQQPVENSLLAEHTSSARRSLSYGTKFALTFGFGALGGYMAGLVWTATGTPASAFYLLAGSATLMAICYLLFRTFHGRIQAPQGEQPCLQPSSPAASCSAGAPAACSPPACGPAHLAPSPPQATSTSSS